MYKIIIDSCGELTEDMKNSGHFVSVPLTLEVDGHHIIDDETFNQAEFLAMVEASPKGPKSACPSPDAYIQAMKGEADRVYVITLSAQLSGSYNSACLAKDLFEEDDDSKSIYVFNSRSASIGQSLIGLKVDELEKKGLGFDEIVEQVEKYIDSQHTYFVLDTLEALRKNGRLSNIKAMIAGTLNIKPVMASTDEGSIQQAGQARGMAKALDKMAECVMATAGDVSDKIVAISHCNCPERAETFKKKLMSLGNFKEIIVLDTRGVSSLYASNGGVIVVV